MIRLHQLLKKTREPWKIPITWEGSIIRLTKKGNRKERENWRSITLLSVVIGMVLAIFFTERLRYGIAQVVG